jgi:hypothetical protein
MRLLLSSPAPLTGGKEEGMRLLLSPSPAPLAGGKEEGRRRRAVVGRGSLLAASGCLSGPSGGEGEVFVASDCPPALLSLLDQEYASSFSFFFLFFWHLLGFSMQILGLFSFAGGWVQGTQADLLGAVSSICSLDILVQINSN